MNRLHHHTPTASECVQVQRSIWSQQKGLAPLLATLTLVLACDSPWSLGGPRGSETQPPENPSTEPNPTRADAETDVEGAESPNIGEWFGLSPNEIRAKWNAWRGDAYELDAVERSLPAGTEVRCERDHLVRYSGETLKYAGGGVTITTAFEARLQRFESIVIETATEVYGRAPNRVRHLGAFACRTSRNRPTRLSEHALGNALDVTGFDFPASTKDGPLPPDLPQALSRAFRVSVAKHWDATGSQTAELHATFLRRMIKELTGRSDVFRGLVGPGQPGHADHFHFDMAPWHYTRL